MKENKKQKLFEKWVQEQGYEKKPVSEFEKEFLETFEEKKEKLIEFHKKVEEAIKDLEEASNRLHVPVTMEFNGITFEYRPDEENKFFKKASRVMEFMLDQGEDDAVFYKIDDTDWSNSYTG